MRDRGFFIVSLCRLSNCQRSKLFMNFLLVFLSPVNIRGGFPLSAPLEGVMMLILCASACAWLLKAKDLKVRRARVCMTVAGLVLQRITGS